MSRTPIIEPLESRRLLAATPVAPLALDDPLDAEYAGATSANLNGTLYYLIHDAVADQSQLMKYDAGSGASTRVTTIDSGYNTPAPQLAAANGFLYFTNWQSSQLEVWRSDGTTGGTLKLATQTPNGGIPSNYHPDFTAVGNSVYFRGATGALWANSAASVVTTHVTSASVYDFRAHNGVLYYSGTESSGTAVVYRAGVNGATAAQLWSGLGSGPLVIADGTLFFVGRPSLGGSSLYASDGTPGGTRALAPISLSTSYPTGLTAVGGRVFFGATNPTTANELWTSDGTTAGTGIVEDISPGDASTNPRLLTVHDGVLYFTISPFSGNSSGQLWRSGGTADSTFLVKDFGPGSAIRSIASVAGRLHVVVATPELGRELWLSDGTADGSRLARDQYPGPASALPHEFIEVGGAVYFQAVDPATGYGLFKTDPATGAVSLVKDYAAGALAHSPYRAFSYGFFPDGRMVFGDGDGTYVGREYYVTDGTPGGTTLIKNISPTGWTGSFTTAYRLVDSNGTIFFGADDSSVLVKNGLELWKTDGTAAGTVLVKDINPRDPTYDTDYSSDPRSFYYFNGYTYFTAHDAVGNEQVWRTDGTADGTVRISTTSSTGGYFSALPVPVGNTLYFAGSNNISKLPPGASALQFVRGFPNGLNTGSGSTIRYAFEYKGAFYFTADDGTNGFELWKSDGTSNGTVMVKDIWPAPIAGASPAGYESASPYGFTPFGDVVLFSAHDGSHGRELWRTDGTAAGTYMVKDIFPDTAVGFNQVGSAPSGMARMGDAMYFVAADRDGTALWKTDGTATGTTIVKRLGPRASVAQFTPAGGLLYFVLDDGVHGKELWVSDGTTDGTHLYADLYPGATGSDPYTVVENHGALWFTANDGATPKLFKIADTTAPDPVGAAAPDVRAPGLVLQFHEPVTLAAGTPGVQLVNRATGQPLDSAAFRLVYDAAFDRVTVRFTTPLPDGDYRLVLPAGTFTDVAGNASTATTHDFFVLAADANHDRVVDFTDLTVLAQNYNTTNKTFAQGDFNYDGKVDFGDLAILAQRYNTTLVAPPPPPAPAAPPERDRDDATLFSTTPIAQPAAPRPRPAARPARR